jgi:hypothetical protein
MNKIRKIKISKETILPILVFIFSVLNIITSKNILSISTLLSVIGIVGVILFFRHNSISAKLIYIWLIAQVLIVEPLFDFSQTGFTLSFTLESDDYTIKINILPLLFLGFLKVMEMSNLIGKEIHLLKFRDNVISDFLPATGKITKRMDFNNDKNWLLIELDKQWQYEGKNIEKVLIKNKEEKAIKLKEKNQIAHLRLVTDENNLTANDIANFTFIDWIRCE